MDPSGLRPLPPPAESEAWRQQYLDRKKQETNPTMNAPKKEGQTPDAVEEECNTHDGSDSTGVQLKSGVKQTEPIAVSDHTSMHFFSRCIHPILFFFSDSFC